MSVLGIIPARGGSKGVPRKNIKLLGGKPLIKYTIEAAIKAIGIDTLIVSTDDQEIANISRDSGALVPFIRPSSLSTDLSSSVDVVLHALNYFESLGITYSTVCLLQPTYPFRRNGIIDSAIKIFTESEFDSLVSVLPVPHTYNPHWTFEVSANNTLKISTGESKIISRRQDLPKAFYRDGSIYLVKSETIRNEKSFLGSRLGYIISDEELYVNIDTLDDWNKAEEKLILYSSIFKF